MKIPSGLIPKCPNCGKPLTMNLRSDDRFVEDEGWHKAAGRYDEFNKTHKGKVLYLELGVGYNTPVIIKYPFWQRTFDNPQATYACINFGDCGCPDLIRDRSILIDSDISKVLEDLRT
jgi:NAD-dependent SIR2 family protein deacetylase